jgi:hypothetical protein
MIREKRGISNDWQFYILSLLMVSSTKTTKLLSFIIGLSYNDIANLLRITKKSLKLTLWAVSRNFKLLY